MATEQTQHAKDGTTADGVASVREAARALGRVLKQVGVLAAVAVWIAFWSLVAQLHVTQGDLVSAAVTGGLFVLPVAAFALRFVAERAGLPDPVSVVSS